MLGFILVLIIGNVAGHFIYDAIKACIIGKSKDKSAFSLDIDTSSMNGSFIKGIKKTLPKRPKPTPRPPKKDKK